MQSGTRTARQFNIARKKELPTPAAVLFCFFFILLYFPSRKACTGFRCRLPNRLLSGQCRCLIWRCNFYSPRNPCKLYSPKNPRLNLRRTPPSRPPPPLRRYAVFKFPIFHIFIPLRQCRRPLFLIIVLSHTLNILPRRFYLIIEYFVDFLLYIMYNF